MAMKDFVAAVVAGGVLCAACGASGTPEAVKPVSPSGDLSTTTGTFVQCSATAGGPSPTYAIVKAPTSGCRALLAGRDYADGRVIVGLKQGATDAELSRVLPVFHATVISSQPQFSDWVVAVPNGSVPEAVVGLAAYAFVAFAAPDMLNQVDPSKV